MKKLLVTAALVALALNAALWGQTINVTAPNSCNEWCKGNTYTITWTKSGAMQDVVAIRLRYEGTGEHGAAALAIVDSTENDGSYAWTIPCELAPGNYYIRVKTVDDTVSDDGQVFKVKTCTPTITVTSPNGSKWITPVMHVIQWTKSGCMQDFVAIRLRYAGTGEHGAAALVITDSTPNDGSYNWLIPNSVVSGDYYIRVKTVDDTVTDDSVNFQIEKRSLIDPGILDKIKKMRHYYIRIPKWPPEPDPWWKIDPRELREIMHGFEGSIFLFKNGQKVKEIGRFGKNNPLTDSLKFQMGKLNSDSLKNRSAKFSLGIFDAQGNLLQETPLEVQVEQQLR